MVRSTVIAAVRPCAWHRATPRYANDVRERESVCVSALLAHSLTRSLSLNMPLIRTMIAPIGVCSLVFTGQLLLEQRRYTCIR